MIAWSNRTIEERGLLNPSFCAMLLWHAARARRSEHLLTLEEAFLILPFVLHKQTRSDLPRSSRTSLAVWLDLHPLARGRIAAKAQLLAPYAREALTFAGVHGFVSLEAARLKADEGRASEVTRILREASDEVRECAKRSTFVSKWFAEAGNAATVFALVGVRP